MSVLRDCTLPLVQGPSGVVEKEGRSALVHRVNRLE